SGVGYLHEKSPIYHTLAVRSVPLGQYDIDYGPAYQKVSPQEKAFFRDLKMSAYVPVSADNRLIGLLASGPKVNDTSYYREDVELLSVIGQQVGTALRSARLIDDLQHLNDSMRVLNKRLEGAKVELEKLDTIKTDFITIASHELRTPLAQIRGYTDILDSLNKSNALKEGQADQLVNNLRKSTERMEELISAMLDVSQIDVNSMDLRFIRTSAETISKMALEPLRDPADERNIEIIRHSAKDLPNIEADLQRMVQALRNIVLNAIKFTPDGGKIEISAELEKAEADGKPDSVVFKIKDSGVGIDKKDIPYIFNKFYRAFDTQLHSSGIYKFMGAGPGLGLTIAKGIIEGHGGSIWAESERHDMNEPPGTTFYVRIPLEPPSGTRRVSPFEEERAVKS
ncbi:MAG: HAMP domain-containing sensor histidine kinase, partial [Chloroflexota bacterium]